MLITYGNNAQSTTPPKRLELASFAKLAEFLNAAPSCPPGKEANNPWWSPAMFDDTKPRKGQAPAWSCLALDFDLEAVKLDGFERVTYESRNSTDGKMRLRIVVAVDEPIEAKYVPQVVALFQNADAKAALPTQVFFHRREGSAAKYVPGATLNWRALVADVGPAAAHLAETIDAAVLESLTPTMPRSALTEALYALDPDLNYTDWLRTGMALHHEYAGAKDGFDEWVAWSERGQKFKGVHDLWSHWKSFTPGGGVTGLSLLQMQQATIDDFPIVPEQPADPVEYLTPRTLLQPRDLPPFLVEGILEQDSECSVIGPTGSYKSLFVFEMCVAVATGGTFFKQPTRQGLVVLLCGEGRGGIDRRLQAIRHARKVDFSDAPLAIYPRPMTLPTDRGVAFLRELIEKAEKQFNSKLALLVIDTYSRYAKGDEDKTGDTYEFFKAARACRGSASLIVCHHTGHGDKSRARGSSAWGQLVDTEFVASIRDDGARMFVNSKQKDGEPAAPMFFRLEQTPTLLTREGKPVGSVVLEQRVGPADVKTDPNEFQDLIQGAPDEDDSRDS